MYNDYPNQCGSCKEYTFEGDNAKGYCRYRGCYYYPNDSCQYYEEKSGSSTGCWLTSACCIAKGLPDDCMELTELRGFRDEILKAMPDGKKLIDFYYAEGPRIVKQIEASEHAQALYQGIYEKIQIIIAKIHRQQYMEAIVDYLFMMYQIDLKSRKPVEIP